MLHRLLVWFALATHAGSVIMAQASEPGSASVASVVRQASPSMVVIRTLDEHGNALALGSGFITSDSRIVTNAHVVAGASVVEVVVPNSGGAVAERVMFAEALSHRADVAILSRVETQNLGLVLAASAPDPGDHVVVIGAPEGLSNTVSDGIASAIRRIGDRDMLQITAPISHGSSGGPVLNMRGEVVGIATAMLTTGQNLNFAVQASEIRTLLNSVPGHFAFPAADRANRSEGAGNVPKGATALCHDGTYSFSHTRRGTCSHHGGVATWIAA